jgi:uncharacterized protein
MSFRYFGHSQNALVVDGKLELWYTEPASSLLRAMEEGEPMREVGVGLAIPGKNGLVIWCFVALLSVVSAAATGSNLRLVDAVQSRDQDSVRSLLKQHADVNATQADGSTALAWAAHWDDLETANLLLQAGANVNAANEYGATPLSLACENGNAAMVDRLLQAGANPNTALLSGETALMTAVNTGNVDVVKLLLAHGADANAKETRRGQTALMWAVSEKHLDAVRWLLEHGADVQASSNSGFTPLLLAAQRGDMDAVQVLLEAGANVNEATPDGANALLLASARGNEKLAVFLLDKGAKPNASDDTGYTALHYAAGRNKIDLVKALLAHGANPNARTRLLQDGAKGVPIGATPLFLAATARNPGVVRLLAAAGADPGLGTTETLFIEGSSGKRVKYVANTTPLMMAAGVGRIDGNWKEYSDDEEKNALETIKELVELGADVNQVNDYGFTPLHGAAYIGADTIVQFLVDKGASMNVIDKFGQTPLSIAELVVTAELGGDLDPRPRRFREHTADLLLKLGATPLAESGVHVLYSYR